MVLWCAGAIPGLTDAVPAVASTPIHFNRDIRPILSDNCFACHGPDKAKRKANLRLDVKESLLGWIEDRQTVAPGQPAQSELFRRISTADPNDRMPPPDSGKRLSPAQIDSLRSWIQQGAPWEGHWAYVPPTRSPVPAVRDTRWVLNPIDAFILARLEKEKLQPTREADRRTLIRRLALDLTGLPPESEAVTGFEQSAAPGVYEKLVDRLLASPHFGERMALYWLDLVRYADTDGFHADNYRSVWPYRDYVIRSFNRNLSFAQFTIEQVAGDLLPNPTQEQIIASTYNRLNRTTEEGGSQPKEYLAKYAADRVRNVSATWLATTFGCAECHNHKFDPFTLKDFYSLEAFFADIKEVGVGKPEGTLLPTPEQAAQLASMEAEVKRLQTVLDTDTPALAEAQLKWEHDLVRQPVPDLTPWHAVGPFTAENFDQAYDRAFGPELNLSQINLAANYASDALKWVAHPEWTDGEVHNDLKGDQAATYLYRKLTATVARPLAVSLGSDDAIKVWLNGKELLAKKTSRPAAPDQEKVTLQLEPGDNHLLLKIVNGAAGYGFYFKAGSGVPEKILAVLKISPCERPAEQKTEASKYYRSIAPELAQSRADLEAAKKKRGEFVQPIPTTLASVAVEPRPIRILARGNWMDDSGEIVLPAIPEVFAVPVGAGGERATRLDLARWLAARENPLTARVLVNRLWRLCFGAGLSKTLDDFGARGEWPTHPELLDWLAVEFMESGWDVKHILKLIVTSRTYRQSSISEAALRERDPANRLLARQSRFRLDAEVIRDSVLARSGLLVTRVGGPSVKPYQPEGYWDHLNFPKRTWQNDHGPALYRRGLYTFWCRTFLQPSLLAFDASAREECTAERSGSNTPLQALALLNDTTYVEAARLFAERILLEAGPGHNERIRWSYEQTLNREPTASELQWMKELVEAQLARYRAGPQAATQLTSTGEQRLRTKADLVEIAAWTAVSRVLFNLHEIITRF